MGSKPSKEQILQDPTQIVQPEPDSEWIELDVGPFRTDSTNLVQIDCNRFIVGQLDFGYITGKHGIYEYSTSTNEWRRILCYKHSINCRSPSIIYNNETHKIWMIGDEGSNYQSHIIEIDIYNANEWNIIYHNKYVGEAPNILLINNKYHIICGSDNSHHLTWNEETKTFDVKHKILQFSDGVYGHRTIYIESKNILLMFGGYCYRSRDHKILDSIYRFSFNDNKWDYLMEVKMPMASSSFGCVLTTDEEYILFFGGNRNPRTLDTIYVLNLNTMKFNLSSIKCPVESSYHAILMTDAVINELVISGYLREETKKNDVSLPSDLFNLFAKWINIDWVHLFGDGTTGHWKITVNQILSSI